MHPRAFSYVADFTATYGEQVSTVVEFGGAVVQDPYQLRRLLPWAAWTAVDIAPGSGVDAVGDCGSWGDDQMCDLVLATELLEHAADPEGVVRNAFRILRPNGWFVATMAGPDRGPHGARGEPTPPAGEHYANIIPGALAAYLDRAGFAEVRVDQTFDRLDLRCTARRH